MSHRKQAAMPIVYSYLKRHPVLPEKIEAEKQSLRISLWKNILKQETTHQNWFAEGLIENIELSAIKLDKSAVIMRLVSSISEGCTFFEETK